MTTPIAATAPWLAATALALALSGCGTGGSNHAPADAPAGDPRPEAARPAAVETAQPAAATAADGIVGAFENASCGERKYRRRVEFFADGRFAGVDEVAPCPPGARCVWSGIIRWQGRWSLEGRTVSITLEATGDGRLPEVVPASFEIISEDPVIPAERVGDLVCPYRRID
jgi:hypothetical protein